VQFETEIRKINGEVIKRGHEQESVGKLVYCVHCRYELKRNLHWHMQRLSTCSLVFQNPWIQGFYTQNEATYV
jgi:hypothetical protein